MQEMSEDRAIHASCYYLPQKFNQWDEISTLIPSYDPPCKDALGLVLLLSKENYEKLGAFDEFYQFWGIEDRDLEHRLRESGIKSYWLDLNKCLLYHQWHPIQNNLTFSFMPEGYWEEAELYFAGNLNYLIRNNSVLWGEVVSKLTRPALKLLDHQKQATLTLEISKHKSVSLIALDIANSFASIKCDESLCLVLDDHNFSQTYQTTVNFINKVLAKLKVRIKFMPVRNKAKDMFWLFYKNNKHLIQDFAISSDEKYLFIIKK